MSYWDKFNLLRKDEQQCFEEAFLEVRTAEENKKIPFKYSTITDDVLVNTDSAIPMSYDKRTKAIFVTQHWLPFVNGARIVFKDKSTMFISSVTKVIDKQKALTDGEGVIGLNLYLGG